MTKLTTQEIEEIKDNADEVYGFAKNVFKYRKDGKETLIQDDKILVEDAHYVKWYEKDVFKYAKDGKDTLIQNGKVLIKNVDWVWWYEKDVFYYKKDGKETLIQNGKILVENVDDIKWYNKDLFRYKKDGKEYEVRKNNKHEVSHDLIIEEWEGLIKNIDEDCFKADLCKKNSNVSESIVADFSISDVPEDERHLVKPGMIFYWYIRKEVKKSGTISNGESLMFRRMPSWKHFDLNKKTTKSDEFFNFLSTESSE